MAGTYKIRIYAVEAELEIDTGGPNKRITPGGWATPGEKAKASRPPQGVWTVWKDAKDSFWKDEKHIDEFAVIFMGDTHYESSLTSDWTIRTHGQVLSMNGVMGVEYPTALGGKVRDIAGVVHLGDIHNGAQQLPGSWDNFLADFGLTGVEGVLRYPIQEIMGNHDLNPVGTGIDSKVIARHGALLRRWDWGGVEFISLNMYPNTDALAWLPGELAAIGTTKPIVMAHHMGFGYEVNSPPTFVWREEEQELYRQVLDGYNIVAIFAGHTHNPVMSTWEGYDHYVTGSIKEGAANYYVFDVLRFKQDQMQVAERKFVLDADDKWVAGYDVWDETDTKTITGRWE